MSKSQILKLIRQDELRRFRNAEGCEEVQPYTRYVVDPQFLTARGLVDHPRIAAQ